jgi:hypothetical protein
MSSERVVTPRAGRTGAAVAAAAGFVISAVAGLAACFPYIGVLGFAGVLGALLCLLSIPFASRKWQMVGVLGLLIGIAAVLGGFFWIDALSNLGGHVV